MNLPKFSIDNPKVIYFFLAVLLFGGILSFDKLGKKEDAPFVIKQAMLLVNYPGATSSEMEQLVTEVVEREIQTMPNTYKLTSESYYGLAKISIELQPDTPPSEIPILWDALRRKVLNVQPRLPAGATIMVNDDFGDVYGIYYGLTADDGFSYDDLRYWAQDIKTNLSVLEQVQQVSIFGEQTPAVYIYISLSKLTNLGIDPSVIIQLIGSQNKLISSGEKQAGDMEIKVVADGTYKSIDDIRGQLIPTKNGNNLYLGDIATIKEAYIDPPSTIMKVDGKRALGIGISTPGKVDVVKAGEKIGQILNQIKDRIPVGIELVTLYPENQIAHQANNGFVINLIESILIVIMILMFVMGFKASILIGSSLLFSIGGTMLIMQFMDVGLNRTSLAGFIIAMGMLVDNAIVVTDNAQVAMKKGINKRDAIINGAITPQWGLLGATLIAIFSFLPLYLAKAAVAEIVNPLFIVIGVSLFLSWFLALTQTTLFANLMFKESSSNQACDPYDKKLYHKFERLLAVLINNRWKTIVSVVLVFFVSLVIMGIMPQNFFPSMDKPYFRADCIFPNGYNIRDVEKDMGAIEKHLQTNPHIKRVSVTMGGTPPRYYLASASYGPMPNYANILIELHSSDSTTVTEDNFNRYVKENYPNIIIKSSLFKLSPVPEAQIEIGFRGNNIDTLIALTAKAKSIMYSHIDIVEDVRDSWGNRIPIWKPHFSQEKGERLAITRTAAAQNISLATKGYTLGEYRKGDQFLPILMRDERVNNFNLNDLRTIPVFSSSGMSVPLEQVIDNFEYDYDFYSIDRYNRSRYMMAQCEPRRGVNASEAFNTVYTQIKEEVVLPDGYELMFLGEKESQDQSNSALAENVPLMFILIFITLLLLFRNYRKPTIILMMVPLIFIGVVLGLVVLGKSFDFFAILGLLGLVGMNIKNAIVLVDQIDIESQAGLSRYDALIAATKSRIVPVAMASGTTILGMLPLLFDSMFGGMAATIMGGLFMATILTILILPVTYALLYKIKKT